MPKRLRSDALIMVWWLAAFVAAVAAIAHIVAYLYVAISRMPFQFTLEWMEGGTLVQVSRILSGELLYVPPSFDFVPQIYPPLFFYLSAFASQLLSSGFTPLRLVSFLSSLVILVLIVSMVRQHSGSTLSGLLAAGVFAATYALSGHWFDVARVDTLALALLLLSVFFLLRDDPISCGLGGVCLALSCLTKQTMLLVAGVLAVYSVLPPRRNSLIFIGTALVSFGGVTLTLNRIHDGWYFFYVFTLPARHSLIDNASSLIGSVRTFFVDQFVVPMPVVIFFGLVYWFVFPTHAGSPNSEPQWGNAPRNGPWGRKFIWFLLLVGGVAAAASIIHLMALPSDLDSRVIGPYSLSRLGLIASQLFIVVIVFALGIRLAKDRPPSVNITSLMFKDVRTVPRLLLASTVLVLSSIVVLVHFQPNIVERLNRAHIERLLPLIVEPVIALLVLWLAWRLIWGVTRLKTWLFIFLGAGLVVTSFLGRLNPGGFANVLMPAYAGIAILFGLGVSQVLKALQNHSSKRGRIVGILVLGLVTVQFISLLSPLAPQIPSVSDRLAGLSLLQRLKDCPGNVYIPYHTYLSELAGRAGHAGWIEMAELQGDFGGEPDPSWKEVRSQIEIALNSHAIAAVIQDNAVFGTALTGEFEPVGSVFSNDRVFWPVTGWQIRPEVVYQLSGLEGCTLKVE